MNREGTLHIVSRKTLVPGVDRFQVGWADYASPGGAMKMKEVIGEQALRDFFTSFGIQPSIVASALEGLRQEGSASILSVVLPERMLISLGLADKQNLPVYPVRFTVFREPAGPILAFSPAGLFMSATFSSKAGVRFLSDESLVSALDDVGLPGSEIGRAVASDKIYNVSQAQLSALGFKSHAF